MRLLQRIRRWLFRPLPFRGIVFDRAVFLTLSAIQVFAFVVIASIIGWSEYHILELITLVVSAWVVRNEPVRAPFAILSTVYFMLVLGGALVMSAMGNVPNKYISVSGTETGWLYVSLLMTALGAKLASALTRNPRVEWYLPKITVVEWGLLWFGLSIIAAVTDIQGNPFLVLLHLYVVPILGLSLVLKLRNFIGRTFVLVFTLLPALMHGQRFLVGIIIAWLFLILLLRLGGQVIRLRRFVVATVLVLSTVVVLFFVLTIIKYPSLEGASLDRALRNIVIRTVVIEAHATLSVKEKVDENAAPRYNDYWLSLIPGISKPVDTGQLVYRLSRVANTRAGDAPYLPPPVPAELYMFGGWTGLIVGSLLLGVGLVVLWSLAQRQREILGIVGFTGPVVAWCGIGAVSMYGRINAVKEELACFVVIWLLIAMAQAGIMLRRKRFARRWESRWALTLRSLR